MLAVVGCHSPARTRGRDSPARRSHLLVASYTLRYRTRYHKTPM